MFYSAIVVIQSTVVLYFFYYGGDTLKPNYVLWMEKKWRQHKQAKAERRRQRLMAGQAASTAVARLRKKRGSLGDISSVDSSDEEDIWWDTSSRDALDLSLKDRNGLSWSERKDDFVDNPSGGGQADVESAPVDAEQLSDIRQRTNSRQISYEEPPKEALASFKTSRRTSHEKKVHRRKSMFSLRSSSDLSKRGTRAATQTAVQVVSRGMPTTLRTKEKGRTTCTGKEWPSESTSCRVSSSRCRT